ncbi:hypothetical protein [Pseudoalteromonas aurantia]|uniref:Uncharacterized protein n=1 Tax=Pseudoalteromonas aurantia 208 TaxID=1314867 RepID=A0ABR9EHL5_9GAMM|nr:hypothetical protein [Pseudoalteromonas aurantia]MBE0370456.1 hypothetical protein [Pseudoalteromonas aurantia 208]
MNNEQHDVTLAAVMRFRAALNQSTDVETFRLIDYSINQGTCHLMRDKATKILMGYVIWANVIEETWQRYVEQDITPIYRHEWQEGEIGMVLGAAINPVYKLNLLENLPEFFYEKRFIYKKRRKTHQLSKVLKKYAGYKGALRV